MTEPPFNPQMYYYQGYYSQLAAQYPVFIRRAVDSDEEDIMTNQIKKA
jgi:hypothetical protein